MEKTTRKKNMAAFYQILLGDEKRPIPKAKAHYMRTEKHLTFHKFSGKGQTGTRQGRKRRSAWKGVRLTTLCYCLVRTNC
jgi:hypothetical protein